MNRIRGKKIHGRPCEYCKRLLIESKTHMTLEERSVAATIDHIEPRSRGGSNNPFNTAIVCSRCNVLKSDWPPSAFLEFSRVILQKFPNATTPVLRRCLNIYLIHLVEVAMDRPKDVRRALSLSLLKMADELESHIHVSRVGK